MEQEILIIGYKSYNFTNDRGDTQSGVKVSYLPTSASVKENEVGYLPIQQAMPYNFLSKLDGVGIYKATFSMVAGVGNKPKIDITDLVLDRKIDFSELF